MPSLSRTDWKASNATPRILLTSLFNAAVLAADPLTGITTARLDDACQDLEHGGDRRPASLARPPSSINSMSTETPSTDPPPCFTRSTVARAVPPVASRSSTISTRCPAVDRVAVHLEAVGAVFEVVGDADRSCRQLAELAHRHEAGADAVGDRRAEDEAAALDADDEVDALAAYGVGQRVDRQLEALGVPQQRGDVVEQDARLGEVRDVANLRLEWSIDPLELCR